MICFGWVWGRYLIFCLISLTVSNRDLSKTKKDRNKQKQQQKLWISSYNCSLWQKTEICQADSPQVMNLPGKPMIMMFQLIRLQIWCCRLHSRWSLVFPKSYWLFVPHCDNIIRNSIWPSQEGRTKLNRVQVSGMGKKACRQALTIRVQLQSLSDLPILWKGKNYLDQIKRRTCEWACCCYLLLSSVFFKYSKMSPANLYKLI